MSLPVLYSFRRCPYAIRARVTLLYSGISVELREIVLRDKPPEFIACSPKATVPVLSLGEGHVLEESLEIMHWTLAQNDPDGWLDGDGAAAEAFITENDDTFKKNLDAYKYSNQYPQKSAEQHRTEGEVFLRKLEEQLHQAPYLQGPKLTMTDVAIAPFVRQFAHVDLQWFQTSAYLRLQDWLQRFKEWDLFVTAMRKFSPWQAGDAMTVFP
jgi:glutathione S-transferase